LSNVPVTANSPHGKTGKTKVFRMKRSLMIDPRRFTRPLSACREIHDTRMIASEFKLIGPAKNRKNETVK
jgi:hypothetical protein